MNMPTCREVATVFSKDELASQPFGRRMLLRWHLYRCSDCRRYVGQLRAIGRTVRDMVAGSGPGSEDLQHLEKEILQQLTGDPENRDRP